jgi:hypothetical protein
METVRIRDGKKSDPGTGINIPDPQHWSGVPGTSVASPDPHLCRIRIRPATYMYYLHFKSKCKKVKSRLPWNLRKYDLRVVVKLQASIKKLKVNAGVYILENTPPPGGGGINMA